MSVISSLWSREYKAEDKIEGRCWVDLRVELKESEGLCGFNQWAAGFGAGYQIASAVIVLGAIGCSGILSYELHVGKLSG
jgi:hypothetical protein